MISFFNCNVNPKLDTRTEFWWIKNRGPVALPTKVTLEYCIFDELAPK
jgi:hypothetical protein